MKTPRFLIALFAALFCATPAFAANLATIAITTAQTAAVSTVYQFRDGPPRNLTIQGSFTYGSGGTTADAWVQTSLDGGTTWIDIANFHFTTSSLRAIYNLNSQTAVTTQYTATDGTLAANTAKDGILGTLIRVKDTTTGTYAASTTLSITVSSNSRVTSSP